MITSNRNRFNGVLRVVPMIEERSQGTNLLSMCLLVCVLAGAFSLRLWSVDFGLDIDRARPDEEFLAGRALAMVESGDLNPHFFHYPSLLIYVDAALLWLAPPLREPEAARLLGRIVSVVCGVGTVLVLAWFGTRLSEPSAGILGAAYLAGAYLPIRESHFGTTDTPFTFLVTMSVGMAWEARRRGSPSWLRVAGAMAGLAASAKYPGILALAPVLFGVATMPGWPYRKRVREAALVLLLAGACFAVTSPYMLLDPEGAENSLGELVSESWGEKAPTAFDAFYAVRFSLYYGLGLPLLSLGLAGLVSMLRRREGRFLMVWAAPFYLAAAFTPIHFARYALPLVPPLCVAAADLTCRLPLPKTLRAALILTVLVPSVGRATVFNHILGREDTRSLASQWIQTHIPAGTGLVLSEGYGEPPIPDGYPVRRVRFRAGLVRRAEEEGFRCLITHEHPVLERFSRIDVSLRERLEQATLLARFDPFRRGRSAGIYDELDAFYLPYADFSGVERPGPVVSIWRLRP